MLNWPQNGGRNRGHNGHGRKTQVPRETSGRRCSAGLGRRHAEPDGGAGARAIHLRPLYSGLLAEHGLSRSWTFILHSHESQGKKTSFQCSNLRSQSYKINSVLKKTNLVANSLKGRCMNSIRLNYCILVILIKITPPPPRKLILIQSF